MEGPKEDKSKKSKKKKHKKVSHEFVKRLKTVGFRKRRKKENGIENRLTQMSHNGLSQNQLCRAVTESGHSL